MSMLRDRRIVTASKFSSGDGRTSRVSTARCVGPEGDLQRADGTIDLDETLDCGTKPRVGSISQANPNTKSEQFG
ncbi:6723_t:CDS:2, partial [Scutellospora calospora]